MNENVCEEAPANIFETCKMEMEKFDDENIASRGMMMTTSKKTSIKLHNDLFPHREIAHYWN